ERILIQITAFNRGPEDASLHLLPTLWFRNIWSWHRDPPLKPQLKRVDGRTLSASHAILGNRYLHCDREVEWLVTDNETNRQRVFKLPNSARYLKDGINNYLAEGRHDAINPDGTGTKAAAHYQVDVPAGGSHQIRLLLGEVMLSPLTEVFGEE